MKTKTITIRTQDYPKCRGFAPGDHIEVEVRTVDCTNPELDAAIDEQVTQITEKYRQEIERRIEKWFKANPDQKECLCEGEEFVGSLWVEANTREEDDPDLDLTQEQMLTILKNINDKYQKLAVLKD